MTLRCAHCDSMSSSVVLTRRATGVQITSPMGKRNRQVILVRTRKCMLCRYKWKTMEVPLRLGKKARLRQ